MNAIQCGHTGQNKPSTLKKVETLEKLESVRNGQMSLMSGADTNDQNRTKKPHTVKPVNRLSARTEKKFGDLAK